MPRRLSRFEMPKRVVKVDATATETYAQFVAEPFEVGYGRTLGNSLRRVLLSSIEGAAITAVRIQGADHEFCCIPDVVEDVTDIVLNLKGVLLKTVNRESRTFRVSVKGPGTVTAADIQTENAAEVLNPDHLIATLAEGGALDMEIEVQTGRGFCPAEWSKGDEQAIGTIPIDAVFSPVRRVNFAVEHTRVGQRTDYDKLILDIWTDGRVSAQDALTISAAVMRHHLDVFVAYDEEAVEFEENARELDEQREQLRRKLAMSVNEIELSVRAANCLNNANITTVGILATKTEADMLKYRNFGKKSLNEIKDKLHDLGLSLGMTFEPGLLPEPKQQRE